MRDVTKAGCAEVIYVPFGYKPSVHFPEPPVTAEEHGRFDSDVVFIGGCDRDRVPFLKTLVRAVPGLNLVLYGGFSKFLLPLGRGAAAILRCPPADVTLVNEIANDRMVTEVYASEL